MDNSIIGKDGAKDNPTTNTAPFPNKQTIGNERNTPGEVTDSRSRTKVDDWGKDISSNSFENHKEVNNFKDLEHRKSSADSVSVRAVDSPQSPPKNEFSAISKKRNQPGQTSINGMVFNQINNSLFAGRDENIESLPKPGKAGPTAKLDFSSGWDLEFEVNAIEIEDAILTSNNNHFEGDNPNNSTNDSPLTSKNERHVNNISMTKPLTSNFALKSALKSANAKSSESLPSNRVRPHESAKKITTILEPGFKRPQIVQVNKASRGDFIFSNGGNTIQVPRMDSGPKVPSEQNAWGVDDDSIEFDEFDRGTSSSFVSDMSTVRNPLNSSPTPKVYSEPIKNLNGISDSKNILNQGSNFGKSPSPTNGQTPFPKEAKTSSPTLKADIPPIKKISSPELERDLPRNKSAVSPSKSILPEPHNDMYSSLNAVSPKSNSSISPSTPTISPKSRIISSQSAVSPKISPCAASFLNPQSPVTVAGYSNTEELIITTPPDFLVASNLPANSENITPRDPKATQQEPRHSSFLNQDNLGEFSPSNLRLDLSSTAAHANLVKMVAPNDEKEQEYEENNLNDAEKSTHIDGAVEHKDIGNSQIDVKTWEESHLLNDVTDQLHNEMQEFSGNYDQLSLPSEHQFDEHGRRAIAQHQQYDQYASEQQYDEHSYSPAQFQQYDDNGNPLDQYQQYDEHGNVIVQEQQWDQTVNDQNFDEYGNAIAQDQQYDEHGNGIVQEHDWDQSGNEQQYDELGNDNVQGQYYDQYSSEQQCDEFGNATAQAEDQRYNQHPSEQQYDGNGNARAYDQRNGEDENNFVDDQQYYDNQYVNGQQYEANTPAEDRRNGQYPSEQRYDEYGNAIAQEWNEYANGQQYDQYASEQQYDQHGNATAQVQQYEDHQYDDHKSIIVQDQQWDQYATEQQYDEHGNVIAQEQQWDQTVNDQNFDEYGNAIAQNQQYDDNGTLLGGYQQYDEHGHAVEQEQHWDQSANEQQYDELGNDNFQGQYYDQYSSEQQYDEYGSAIIQDQQWDQYDTGQNDDKYGNFEASDLQKDVQGEILQSEANADPFCANCSKMNGTDANFCVNCGKSLRKYDAEIKAEENINNFMHEPVMQLTNPQADARQRRRESRDNTGRTAHCIAIFGFGGKLITMRPKRQKLYQADGRGGQIVNEKIYPGTIDMKRVEKCLFPSFLNEANAGSPIYSASKMKKDKLKLELNFLRAKRDADEYHLLLDFIESVVNNDCSSASFDKASKHLMEKLKPENLVVQNYMDQILVKLFEGSTKDACYLAVSGGIWPVALILASRISQEVYSDIVLQFSMSGIEKSCISHKTDFSLQILLGVMGGSEPVSMLANRLPSDLNFFAAFADFLNLHEMYLPSQICCLLGLGAASSCGRFPLVGGQKSSNVLIDVAALRLTEIFEYCLITSFAKAQTSPIPHFQAYKLWYAVYLADLGMISSASAYVSSISAVTKALPQPCPFIHGIFGLLLKELGDRLEVVYGAELSVSRESTSSGGWLGKITENFTGAALGRGLETLMNSAVGVPSSQSKSDHPTTVSFSDSMNESQLNNLDSLVNGDLAGNYHTSGVPNNHIYPQTSVYDNNSSSEVPQYYNEENYGSDLQNYGEEVIEGNIDHYETNHENSYNFVEQSYTNQVQINSTFSQDDTNASSRNDATQRFGGALDHNSADREKCNASSQLETTLGAAPDIDANSFKPIIGTPITDTIPEMPKTYFNDDEVEDLGFGNSKKSVLPPSGSIVQRPNMVSTSNDEQVSKETIKKDTTKPASKGFFGSFVSVLGFGGKKDGDEGPKKAHLPSGSSFHYDPVLKKWVNKNGGSEKPKEELAPPPIISPAVQATLVKGDATEMSVKATGNNAPALHTDRSVAVAGAKGKRKSARSKYVDVLNPDSAPKTQAFMPSFSGPAIGGQKPKMMNVPVASPNMQPISKSRNQPDTTQAEKIAADRSVKPHLSPMIQAKRMSRPPSTSNLIKGKTSRQGAPPDL